jgi:nucleotide-binding universal stress UspA family protein
VGVVMLVVLGWLAVGVAVALVMIRRGHAPVIWLALSFYGPLLVLLAVSARDAERRAAPEVLDPGRPGAGNLEVVAGIDGSDESTAAARAAVELFGDRLHRLTLATVVDYDIEATPTEPARHDEARAGLERAAAELAAVLPAGVEPRRLVLTGNPTETLAEFAATEGTDLVVVGARGHGATRHLVGRVATHLPARSSVPVLVVPAEVTTMGAWPPASTPRTSATSSTPSSPSAPS